MRPSQRPWFRALTVIVAGVLYVIACPVAAMESIYGPASPFSWWHPVALVCLALLAAAVMVVERMVMPSAERAHNSVYLTDDEWELVKQFRETSRG